MGDVPRARNDSPITLLTVSQICMLPGPTSESTKDLILDLILDF